MGLEDKWNISWVILVWKAINIVKLDPLEIYFLWVGRRGRYNKARLKSVSLIELKFIILHLQDSMDEIDIQSLPLLIGKIMGHVLFLFQQIFMEHLWCTKVSTRYWLYHGEQ